MEWSNDLSVGLEIIDTQHRELFVRIGDLVTAIKQHTCKYKIGDVMKFLEEYVVFHFSEEENFMKAHNYPDYLSHKAQHEIFIENLHRLKEELPKLEGGKKPGSYDLSVETNQLVVDWILDHIIKIDKELGTFLKGKI